MSSNVTELEDGRVSVRIRSRRGTGTRDQDEIIVQGVYESIDEAERESPRLNQLVEERMEAARQVENGDEQDEDEPSDTSGPSEPAFSKVYLGDGSRLSGWIPLPRQLVFDEIAPLVSKNTVEDDDVPGIKVNFSKDVPISGWTEVDADVVSNEIEPIVREQRLDD